MIRKTVYYSGRVQGVGFRYTTCQIAEDYPVVGFVKNLPDGRVEVVVEGEAAVVERFTSVLTHDMGSYIRRADEHEAAATGEFRSFDVKF
jgi:acylphosphatase